MRPRSLLLAALLFAPVLAPAQSATLEFDTARRGFVYVSAKPPVARPEAHQEFEGTSVVLTSLPASGTVYVWDFESGNVATKPVAEVGKKWRVSDKEFDRIGLVSVRVEYKGEAVASARVVLKDKGREQSQILDATAKGEADFYVVQPGAVTVTVEYRSAGSSAQPVVQQFPLDLQRKTANPLLTIALPNPVETVARPATPEESGQPPAEEKANGGASTGGSWLSLLATLVIAGGLAYGLYYLAKKRQDQLKDLMKKVGVDIPEPTTAVKPDVSQPTPDLIPAKPQPQSKIILDDGGMPPAAAAPVAASVSGKEPRLVRADGTTFEVVEGETLIGREQGLELSLVGEDSVSRRHASISRAGSKLTLKDLGSTNGTYVNGRKITAETELSSGDDVQFGAVKFRVETR